MTITVIDCGSKYIEDIGIQLKRLGIGEKRVKVDAVGIEDLKHVSGIVISGSPKNLSQDDGKQVLEKLRFLKDVEKPVLGICFGHQALGVLYGGQIYREQEEEIYLETIEITKQDALFEELGNTFLMEERHHEWIDLPSEFELLASSKSTKVEAMKHRSKLVYGVQFHPEISGEPGKRLIENFLKLCK